MNSGGELNGSIQRLIRRECAHAVPEQIESCVEAVTKKAEDDLIVLGKRFKKMYKLSVKDGITKFRERKMEQKREEEIVKKPSPIIWEQPLALLDDEITHFKFKFTHVDEWRKVETKMNGLSLEWSYFLTKNADESFTVRWRKEGKEEQSLTFNLANGFFPSSLMLAVQEDQNIQLILK